MNTLGRVHPWYLQWFVYHIYVVWNNDRKLRLSQDLVTTFQHMHLSVYKSVEFLFYGHYIGRPLLFQVRKR